MGSSKPARAREVNRRNKVIQLPLPLRHPPALGAEDFLVSSCNRAAVTWLRRWPDWPAVAIAIVGPEGCGKTHLARVFMTATGAREVSAASLASIDPPHLLQGAAALVIDDCDERLGDAAAEEALLHLFNSTKEQGCTLLLTAAGPPARWPMALPDLASRLKVCPVIEIERPDEDLLAAILVKLFGDRRLSLQAAVIPYLQARLPRSFAAAHLLVSSVDELAMSTRRKITLALVRDVVERLDASGAFADR